MRIRGIYSTALTKLLLDNGFEIVDPSEVIRKRFNLRTEAQTNREANLNIYDRLDRQGVNVIGDSSSVQSLVKVLQATFDDAVYRQRVSVYNLSGGIEDYSEPDLFRNVYATSESIGLSVEFPSASKKVLDNLRAQVAPTLDGHHFYKACGGRVSYLLEMAEKMLEKDCPKAEVESFFKETVEREFPGEGSNVGIEHVKIDGATFDLGPAKIVNFDKKNGKLTIQRSFFARGFYDGLRTLKEPGDCAITEMKLGEWSFKTKYISKDGKHKGTYININTPVEIYPEKIRYVDLEVDICLWPNWNFKIIDMDKLEEALARGQVAPRLKIIIDKEIEKIINFLGKKSENVEE